MASNFRPYDGNVWMARLTSAMSIRPCLPDVTLADGAKYVAILQCILSGFYTMVCIMCILIYAIILNIPSNKARTTDGQQVVKTDDVLEDMRMKFGGGALIFVVLFIGVVIGSLCVALQLYLYRAVKQKNPRQVNRWWWIFLGISVLNTSLFITVLASGTKSLSFFECLEVLFDFYCLWVVRAFYSELVSHQDNDNQVTVGFAVPSSV